jgi:two-component system sensor histidine kinase UhpB
VAGTEKQTGSIFRQVVLAFLPFGVLVSLLVFIGIEGLDILSALRACARAESNWSSAQKSAISHLRCYAHTGNERCHANFLASVRIIQGDRLARLELLKANPDRDVIRNGLMIGNNDPRDVPGITDLLQRYGRTERMQRAFELWAAGDTGIDQLVQLGSSLHDVPGQPHPPLSIRLDDKTASATDAQLDAIDARLSATEQAFASMIGSASRSVVRYIEMAMIAFALLFGAIKLVLMRWTLRRHEEYAQALRTSEERFDMAVRGSNDGIWNWTPDQAELYLSPRAVQLLGYPFDDVPRRPADMLKLIPPEDRSQLLVMVAGMLHRREPLDVEFRFLDWGGNYRWIRARGQTVRMVGGRAARASGSITDITEHKHIADLRRMRAEEERRRNEQAQMELLEQVQEAIGRELHDDLGQKLTGIAFLAKALQQRLTQAHSPEIGQTGWIVKLINESIDRVRFLSRQLNPIEIDHLSLGDALRRLVDDIRDIFGTHIVVCIRKNSLNVPDEHARQLFRIAQESISNALRHGEATRVTVYFDACPEGLRLAILDNGRGFDVAAARRGNGLGLRSMLMRAEAIHGQLRIRSSPRGTAIVLRSMYAHAPVSMSSHRALLDAREASVSTDHQPRRAAHG